jgi:RNA polymerase-binding transcription factor
MDLDAYRARLQQLESDLTRRLTRDMDSGRAVPNDQAESGDLATAEELKDEYFAGAESDALVLSEVRAALQRINDGTYGRCVIDGGPIEEKRLQSIPWTPYCLKHQQELEEQARTQTPSM